MELLYTGPVFTILAQNLTVFKLKNLTDFHSVQSEKNQHHSLHFTEVET